MVTAVGGRLCPACGFAAEGASLTCGSCSFILDIRAAEPALQRALDAAEEETAQLAAARALVEIPDLTSRRYVRDWLLRRIPAAHCASAMVEDIGVFVKTDAEGLAELALPAGTTEIRASKDKLEGRATVTVGEGGTAAVDIKLGPAPAGGTP